MHYSDAFNRLYAMSEKINLRTEVKYRRVAIFLGRIMMAETTLYDGLGTPVVKTWQEEVKQFRREDVFSEVALLQDTEWEMVRGQMANLAVASSGREDWRKKRLGWVADLDTIRAFG